MWVKGQPSGPELSCVEWSPLHSNSVRWASRQAEEFRATPQGRSIASPGQASVMASAFEIPRFSRPILLWSNYLKW